MRLTIAAASAACFTFVGLASAADPAPPATPRATGEREQRFDKKTAGDAVRVSQIRGMTVRNSGGKDLGDIKDLMLDMGGHGRVRYAAMSFGGFLGMGDKLFAIPWRALKFQHDSEKNKDFVIFDATEESLKKTPGFDKDHWPDMADRTWMQDVDQHHGVDVKAGNTEVHVRTNNDRAAERRDVRTPADTAQNEHNWRLHRASEAIGMKVKNAGGDKLGKVEDIVVATGSGDIRYLALSFGGFLGIGDKFFAVPWDAVMLQHENKEHFVMFDVTKDQLENAPGFDKDHWPDFGNEKWAATNDQHFTAHRQRKGTTQPVK
ncbi:MAG TPA: PRC-barrel domain-containing protein [Pirellulales bacterium]|nr:PRC-barrel domain-containing protein [Pirellulales bacterium]